VKVIKSRFRAQHSVVIAGSAKDAEEFEIVHDFPAKFRCSRKTRSHLIEGLAQINEDPEYLGRPRGIYDAAPTAIAEITN